MPQIHRVKHTLPSRKFLTKGYIINVLLIIKGWLSFQALRKEIKQVRKGGRVSKCGCGEGGRTCNGKAVGRRWVDPASFAPRSLPPSIAAWCLLAAVFFLNHRLVCHSKVPPDMARLKLTRRRRVLLIFAFRSTSSLPFITDRNYISADKGVQLISWQGMVQEAWVEKAAMLGEKHESASLSCFLSLPPVSPSFFAALGHVTHDHTVPKRVVSSAAIWGGRLVAPSFFSPPLPFQQWRVGALCAV